MAAGRVLPYLDVPFQHCAPRGAQAHEAPASGERNLERLAQWREAVPTELVVRSTFIAGFPGRDRGRVRIELLNFMREAGIDRAGCFAYSPVEGATANDLPGHVPQAELREERRARFMAVAEQVSAASAAAPRGRHHAGAGGPCAPALGRKGGLGRSYADAPEIDGTVRLLPPEKASRDAEGGRVHPRPHRGGRGARPRRRCRSEGQHNAPTMTRDDPTRPQPACHRTDPPPLPAARAAFAAPHGRVCSRPRRWYFENVAAMRQPATGATRTATPTACTARPPPSCWKSGWPRWKAAPMRCWCPAAWRPSRWWTRRCWAMATKCCCPTTCTAPAARWHATKTGALGHHAPPVRRDGPGGSLAAGITPKHQAGVAGSAGSVTMEFPEPAGLVQHRAQHGGAHRAGQHLGRRHRLQGLRPGHRHRDAGADQVPLGRRRRADGLGGHARRSVARQASSWHHMHLGLGVAGNDAELAILRSMPTPALRYHAQDAAGRAVRPVAGHAAARVQARVLHPALRPASPGHAHWKALCKAAAGACFR